MTLSQASELDQDFSEAKISQTKMALLGLSSVPEYAIPCCSFGDPG